MFIPMHVQHTVPYCIYNRLPEDEPSVSTYVDDIVKNSKIKILTSKIVHFVVLYCIIILRCEVQKT